MDQLELMAGYPRGALGATAASFVAGGAGGAVGAEAVGAGGGAPTSGVCRGGWGVIRCCCM